MSLTVGFIGVSPGLNEFFLEVIIDGVGWSGRCGNGHNPVLHTSLPFIDVGSGQIDEDVRNFAPGILHNGVEVVYELI